MSSHAFHRCYYHITWATKERLPMITPSVCEWLLTCLREACHKRGVEPLACNAMPDHVHLLVSLPPTVCPATFIGQLKGATSRVFNQTFGDERHLMWQEGYGVVTLRAEETDKVIRYIENQQEIHAARRQAKQLETYWSD